MGQRSIVTFYLNGEKHQVQPDSPTQTGLQYLRECLHLTGTKEGCAEGDCGACTITEASLDTQGQVRYRAINACIRFLPTLDGRSIWTVEGLAQSEDHLHPVQQAMVDHHGSQCGFCAPGFVMSLYTLYAQGVHHPTREHVVDQLSGNLCRCTGYGPIIDAGLAIGSYPKAGPDTATVHKQLQELSEGQTSLLSLTADGQSYHAPRSTSQLTELIQQHPDAVVLAGGTDVGLWVTKQLRRLDHVIYLGDVRELQTIDRDDGAIRIKAAVLLEDAYRELSHDYPELTELWKRFASTPIRSSGTLVGNLANGSPIGDTAPILIALGAKVVLQRGRER